MIDEIRSLFQFSISNISNKHRVVELVELLNDALVTRIQEDANINLTNFCIEIDN